MTNRANLTIPLLSASQALAMTGNVLLFTTATLVGYELATDKSLATLPLAIQQIATMVATIPASLLMKRFGRRSGFLLGGVVGMAGASLAARAVLGQNFLLFCAATLLYGIFNGFVSFYRFAAADAAAEGFRSQSISLVVAGGIVAAIAGPWLAVGTKDLFALPFLGCYVAIVLLQLLALPLLALIHIPPLSHQDRTYRGRPLGAIAQQPLFIAAVVGSMMGYGVMSLVMTATPLAMTGHNHSFATASQVIQWHVLGMFVPSLFTGWLIRRLGVMTIIFTGIGLNMLCMLINLSGTTVLQFTVGLLLLGLGWNFMYVGSSTLLTQTCTPTEEAKAQATHDFLMFAFVAFTTYLSGGLLNTWRWAGVNWVGLAMMAIALGTLLWCRRNPAPAL